MTNSNERDDVGISVVVPCYRSELNLVRLYEELSASLEGRTWQIILVDDASGDATWEVINDLSGKHQNVRGIRLARNSGQHCALHAGIMCAEFPVTVTMDDDLQNPPAELKRLLAGLSESIDLVYGWSPVESQSLYRRLASKFFWFAFQLMFGEKHRQISSFRCFRTELRGGFTNPSSPIINIDAMLSWTTRSVAVVEVENHPRASGSSSYSTRKLIRHALELFQAFGATPLRFFSLFGALFSLSSVILTLRILWNWFFGDPPPGYSSLAALTTFVGGILLLGMAVLSKYIGTLIDHSAGRTPYLVIKSCGNEE